MPVEKTLGKIIRCPPTLNSVGSDALHVVFHELSNQYKGFGVIGDDDWTKLEQLEKKADRFGKGCQDELTVRRISSQV